MTSAANQSGIDRASRMRLRDMHDYARELRDELPAEIFRRRPSRLGWLVLHGAVIVALTAVVLDTAPPWWAALLCAVAIGHSWGCLGFLAHETLHHAVTGSRALERAVGYLAFLPYATSPTLWTAWHNQTHHAHTGHLVGDTDQYGTLAVWRSNPYLRRLEAIAPGSGGWPSWFFLPTAFTVQAWVVLLLQSERKGFYRRISRRAVWLETGSMIALWGLWLALIGPYNFLFLGLIPMLTGNAMLMSYIATNHYLNPLTSTNDPLVNTLSVRDPAWLETLHLQFGYHVEHHIFPTMSARHAPLVREVLIRRYGDRYLSLPHLRALRLVYARPKVHRDADTLVDPRSGATYRALAPGQLELTRLPETTAAIAR
ncbi:MAG TPA: fatty acid desaturase [Candidatus Dormibacteraeota bacterium]|nr:fatty acid desaturase [Candidatus Dormibacteraeota bacterium]